MDREEEPGEAEACEVVWNAGGLPDGDLGRVETWGGGPDEMSSDRSRQPPDLAIMCRIRLCCSGTYFFAVY